jgi:glycerol-3-phosphate O-acyltransferase 1/2
MRSQISSSLLTIAGWILFKILSKILTSIQYSKKQVDHIRQVRKGCRYPILYLPVHRSHLDYILVSFILHMNGVKPPLVAAGDNLYIPFFGNLMKGLGAFFIKRKLDPKQGQKDHIYRAVLEAYMTENLRSGQCMEFFVEGGRSRTGKALMPKAGLLSVVVNAVLNNDVEDVCIVPVGISYDKLIEGSFIAEQLGKAKVRESFTLAAKAVWATLRSNFGSARVDFGTPFSLKDYLKASSSDIVPCIMHSESTTKNYYCDAGGDSPELRSVSSSASLYGLEVIVEEDKRQVIQRLADHVVYDASNASAIMSTQMLAFVLLTCYRKGATLRQIIPTMTWLKKELALKGRDVGFSGDTATVVRYASTLLGRDLVTTETIQMAWSSGETGLPTEENNNSSNNRIKKIVLVKPATKVPAVLELQYYSNAVASSFAMESIVGKELVCYY